MSRRTIDYYTNLELLNPIRSESNYRYYTERDLMRLKVIEAMKRQRFKLDEIKERLNKMENNIPVTLDVDELKEYLKQLEKQLKQLQPLLASAHSWQEVVGRKTMMQTVTLIQSITIYIGEVLPYL